MSVYIDSANLEEVRSALDCGWVYGITTNPVLLARETDTPEEHLRKLAGFQPGEIYYQVQPRRMEDMQAEASRAHELLGDRMVAKIPPTEEGLRFAAAGDNPWKTCITAVFSPAQALAAGQAGADYIAVYYSRMNPGEADSSIRAMRAALMGTETEIIAASLKSNSDITAALHAGSQHFTLPYTVLKGMLEHELSDQAVAVFQEDGVYLA